MRIVTLSFLIVALGGALGAMARYALNLALQRDVPFPWGTLSANLLGCFVMGIVLHLVATSAWFNEGGLVPDHYRLLFAIGFCGSFTTLSTLVVEVHAMMQKNEILASFSYLMGTMIGGFAFFYAGVMLARMLIPGSSD